MIFEQTILVKSYLLKFLSKRVPTDPFILTERNRYGIFIINMLRHSDVIRTHHKYEIKEKTDKLRIRIKEHYERAYGINISAWHQWQFNNMLRDEFQDRMLEYVTSRNSGRKGDIKNALQDFLDIYDISEDDLPFRTLIKMWERESVHVSA
jgi:hypothetical protein